MTTATTLPSLDSIHLRYGSAADAVGAVGAGVDCLQRHLAMIPRRRPKLNACDCGRAKLRTDTACTRCARIESRQFTTPKKEGKRDPQWIYSDITRALDDFLKSRGIDTKPGQYR